MCDNTIWHLNCQLYLYFFVRSQTNLKQHAPYSSYMGNRYCFKVYSNTVRKVKKNHQETTPEEWFSLFHELKNRKDEPVALEVRINSSWVQIRNTEQTLK